MRIVHLTTEYAPFAKVGGLGDVVQGLSKALVRFGQNVEVIIPLYGTIEWERLEKPGRVERGIFYKALDGVELIFIKSKTYFERGRIYGEEDDVLRFACFVKKALDYLLKRQREIDILHIHDWMCALCAPMYREVYQRQRLGQRLRLVIKKIVTTIHNLSHQGRCKREELVPVGLKFQTLFDKEALQERERPGTVNCLKGGAFYSDFITTVSSSYAREIKDQPTDELGVLLAKRGGKFRGILNGIDTDYWDPTTDPFVIQNFSPYPTNIERVIEGKKKNRAHLLKRLKMERKETPLFIVITRLVEQKGPELIGHGLEYVLKKGGQFILIGTLHEAKTKKYFDALEAEYQNHPSCYLCFRYDEPLTHLAYASAHFILIPSLFEPCGLTQMIALRYATLPIVHQVGGLKETIFDIDKSSLSPDQRNGYTFNQPSKKGLERAIDRAFHNFQKNGHLDLIKNGLKKDWSWETPAKLYVELYRSLLG